MAIVSRVGFEREDLISINGVPNEILVCSLRSDSHLWVLGGFLKAPQGETTLSVFVLPKRPVAQWALASRLSDNGDHRSSQTRRSGEWRECCCSSSESPPPSHVTSGTCNLPRGDLPLPRRVIIDGEPESSRAESEPVTRRWHEEWLRATHSRDFSAVDAEGMNSIVRRRASHRPPLPARPPITRAGRTFLMHRA